MVGEFGELVLSVTSRAYDILVGRGWIDQRVANVDDTLSALSEHSVAIPRNFAETSLEFRQIIPQIVIRCGDEWLLHRRTTDATEKRLHGVWGIALGGHVSCKSTLYEKSRVLEVNAAAYRELKEESSVKLRGALRLVALLTNDLSEVSKHHAAVVYTGKVFAKSNIMARESDLDSIEWATTDEIREKYYDLLDNWSQIMFLKLSARSGALG
jgi:predicted NUDIX family phosphoesterase